MSQKRYEVYQTNPIKAKYEGPLASAIAFYNATKDKYFKENHTLGIRVLNSYHWQWVEEFMYKYYGFTGINPETMVEYFVPDLDHPFNDVF